MTGDCRFMRGICKGILVFPSYICFDVRCNCCKTYPLLEFFCDEELTVKTKEMKRISKESRGHSRSSREIELRLKSKMYVCIGEYQIC